MKKTKGFTIIELIVVIAIIAVLAAVVAVNVVSYIAKGRDAAYKANLKTLATNAAVFFDTNNSVYTGFCTDAVLAVPALDKLATNRDCNVNIGGTAWAACSELATTTGKYWCVDNTGASKEVTATAGTCVTAWTATACP